MNSSNGCCSFWNRGSFPFQLILALCLVLSGKAQSISNTAPVVKIKLTDYLQQVLHHNQALKAQMFGSEASRRRWKAERGIFEPQLKLSAMRVANRRTNNVQQRASQSGGTLFDERNNIYDSGLQTLLPTGGKIQLGYTLSDLENNLSGNVFNPVATNYIKQYQTFVGVTFTQPLLKNGGVGATLAQLRLAAADSEIGFQKYRRQLMMIVAQAESAYWNLYFAQEQLHFFDNSVAVAKNVLVDSRHKLKAGQGSELDVMEAKSGLALRQTKRNEAVQSYYDALDNLQSLAGITPSPQLAGPADPLIRAVDVPPETNAVMTYADGFNDALTMNPDFLIQKQKMKQEAVRLGYAKNQLLPELDFKAAYGYNGLGSSPGESWSVARSEDYPSWSMGLELTIPLAGNIKGRNLVHAAKLTLKQAYAKLCETQDEIANHLSAAIRKTRAWHQSIKSYETVVTYNRQLLQTDIARFKAGTIDGHKVLEVEADLLDARQNLANALVQYQQSELQVGLSSGSLLKDLHLEVTREELKEEVAGLVREQTAAENIFKN